MTLTTEVPEGESSVGNRRLTGEFNIASPLGASDAYDLIVYNHHQNASRQLYRGLLPPSSKFGISPCLRHPPYAKIMYLHRSKIIKKKENILL